MNKLLGGLLMGCGILIAGATGLCLSLIMLMALGSPGGMPSDLNAWAQTIGSALLLFAIPIAVGIGLFVAGRYLTRQD